MSVELTLLNAVIAKRDLSILVRHGLMDDDSWHDQRKAFRFIRNHAAPAPVGYGELPSIESVAKACDTFESVDVTESPDTLAAKMHEKNHKIAIRRMLESAAKQYQQFDGYTLEEFLRNELEKVRDRSRRKNESTANWTKNVDDRIAEYERRKSKEFHSKIPLFWPVIDDAVGGFSRGDYVNIQAWTKVGKSWLGALAGLTANRAGFRVLAELAESTKTEALFRLDTLEFAINNRRLFTGTLDEDTERMYVDKLNELRASTRPDYVIRTPEDWQRGLTIHQLEADIIRYKADVAIVDQFSLMQHDGHDVAAKRETSRNLKLMFSRLDVLGIVITQASGEFGRRQQKEDDTEGMRELEPPTERDYSETIGVIQDATHVIALDSFQWRDADGKERGKALANVPISRTGGAGTSVHLNWLPGDGVIEPRSAADLF